MGTAPVRPRRRRSMKGVTKMPSRLPRTALKTARASSPPAVRESATHMLTVVGSTDRTRKASRMTGLSRPSAERGAQAESVRSGTMAIEKV
eukprot:scaffold19178_cov129-Isochrysis_galbana.AAC.3